MRMRESTHRSIGKQLRTLVVAVVLASVTVAGAPKPVSASTPCSVTLFAPTTNGVVATHVAYGDCPPSPTMDWIKGQLYSLFFAWPTLQASCINNNNSSNPQGCQSQYNCNGSGTLEHFGKVNVRDIAGGETGWRESGHAWLTC